MNASKSGFTRAGMALAAVLALSQLQGCFVLGVAAVGGTAMVATDRRSSGTQLADQTIQIRATGRAHDYLRGNGNLDISSYDYRVLVAGQVPTAEDKAQVLQLLGSVPEVRGVDDEIVVGANQTLGDQAHDGYLTSKVRAAFIDDKKLYSQAFQITTTAGVVYLQGIVTQAEADEAAAVASGVSGVQKVVTLFEIITPEQLRSRYADTAKTPVTPAGSAPTAPANP